MEATFEALPNFVEVRHANWLCYRHIFTSWEECLRTIQRNESVR